MAARGAAPARRTRGALADPAATVDRSSSGDADRLEIPEDSIPGPPETTGARGEIGRAVVATLAKWAARSAGQASYDPRADWRALVAAMAPIGRLYVMPWRCCGCGEILTSADAPSEADNDPRDAIADFMARQQETGGPYAGADWLAALEAAWHLGYVFGPNNVRCGACRERDAARPGLWERRDGERRAAALLRRAARDLAKQKAKEAAAAAESERVAADFRERWEQLHAKRRREAAQKSGATNSDHPGASTPRGDS